ncbi:hypothetical protein [Sphingobacterium yanglingense]|uniref:TolB-like protein n=1 Tax=Sphingobacterium yanglingense TaxID=1437280 RepID=A0A4R6WGK1_9SPHI|nr:hypothetical protein [Sphingobacterium yanglingense]TDQ76516.1 hypothetical protein CLV99_3109 [Sphingobacterium yanglingense]
MKNYLFSIVVGCILISIAGCKRDDDEPERVRKPISRLYVSTSDYSAGSASASIFNVWPVDNVDGEELPDRSEFRPFKSAAKGGRMIHYSPFNGGRIFQGSMNPISNLDTAVHVMGISKTGVLDNKSSLNSRIYDNVRGLYYTVESDGKLTEDYLLIANASDTTDGANDPNYTLFAVFKPENTGSYSRPRYRMKLRHNPWGVLTIDRDLIISRAEEGKGAIIIYKGYRNKLLQNGDSVMQELDHYVLNIPGANNVRGISYSKSADILMVTDYGPSTSGTTPGNVGRILIFEKFSQYKAAQDITPTRIVEGDLTQLKEPTDVAIDGKAGGKYFFVADPVSKRVYRFLISDNGNVKPNGELNFDNRPPQSVSLDSR